MSKDTKLDSIELKEDLSQINTDQQRLCARRLMKHWPEIDSFKEYEQQFPRDEASEDGVENPSQSLYRDVYARYFGPVDDPRTVEQLRSEFGSITDYLKAEEYGGVEPQVDKNEEEQKFTEREFEIYREGYRDGQKDAYRINGWDPIGEGETK